MATKGHGPRKPPGGALNENRLDAIVAGARKASDTRMAGYREQSLRLHPWVCARCGREFTRANLHELTVHHKDHDHDNNPPDGSNWENLCLYCHDWEHQKHVLRSQSWVTGIKEMSRNGRVSWQIHVSDPDLAGGSTGTAGIERRRCHHLRVWAQGSEPGGCVFEHREGGQP